MADGSTADLAGLPAAATDAPASPDYLASLRLALPHLKGSRLALAATVVMATASVACELVPVWAVYRAVSDIVAGAATWTSMAKLALVTLLEYLAGMAIVKVFNRSGESFASAQQAIAHYRAIGTAWARSHLPLEGNRYGRSASKHSVAR